MRVYDLKTNRVANPLGFKFDAVRLSYKVDGTKGKKQTAAQILIATDAGMKTLVYDSGKSEGIDSLMTLVDIQLAPYTRYYWTVEVWADNGDSAVSEINWFETAKMADSWTAKWISPTKEAGANADMTFSFTARAGIASARAYITGVGLYEMYLNGKKTTEEVLTPYCNAYDKWIQYQTYDVTEFIAAGENDIRVMLGDGWYKGRFGFQTNEGNTYGNRQALLAEIRITYTDGSVETIATSDAWKCAESKVRFANLYDGEDYDATYECKGGFPVEYNDLGMTRLTERLSLPVKVMERIAPIEVIHTPAGETVIDLGQEITGYLEFKTRAPKGTKIKLSYGEILQHDNFYNENLRTAKAEYFYTADGTETTVRPIFTFYGFRYVKIEGLGENLDLSDFCGCVLYSDMAETGKIETSNPKVNRFALNAMWGQKGNYLDVPTDCPQRDERMGWTGDAQAFIGTACFNMEVAAFMQKYIYDMGMEQSKFEGSVPHVIPSFEMGPGGSCAWADAATIIPWTVYTFYGDKELLKEQYKTMRDWVEWIYRTDEQSGGKRLWHVGFHFADWLALDSENNSVIGGTDSHFVASAYYYYSATLTLKAAKALGITEDIERYTKLTKEIYDALVREYFTESGRLAQTTQTAYICALFMQFTPEEYIPMVSKLLGEKFRASNEKLRTGFVGTAYLNRVLANFGHNEMAYKLLLNEEYPGWLYEVNMGATTVWERWNSVLPNGLISDVSMNSLNHYAYGAVMEWVYRDVAGINPTDDAPGFRRAFLRPRPNYRLPEIAAEFDSAVGLYKSAWKIEKNAFTWNVTVPFGATAKCVIPYGDLNALKALYPDLAFTQEGDDVVTDLTAGDYTFAYKPVKPLHEVYSYETPLEKIKENADLWGKLTELLPEVFARYGNQRRRGSTLGQLREIPFIKIADDVFKKIDELLESFS